MAQSVLTCVPFSGAGHGGRCVRPTLERLRRPHVPEAAARLFSPIL